jgi:hypothetical protein
MSEEPPKYDAADASERYRVAVIALRLNVSVPDISEPIRGR